MIKNRKYIKNRRYSENWPVQPKNRKNRKLNRFLTGWGIFIFFYFPGDYTIYTTSFWPFVLKWKSNPKPKLKSLSPHLQASSSDENLTHAACLKLASASVKLAARLSQACLKLAARCLPQSSALSTQRRVLHSGSDALCTAASCGAPCSALCTAAQVMFYF